MSEYQPIKTLQDRQGDPPIRYMSHVMTPPLRFTPLQRNELESSTSEEEIILPSSLPGLAIAILAIAPGYPIKRSDFVEVLHPEVEEARAKRRFSYNLSVARNLLRDTPLEHAIMWDSGRESIFRLNTKVVDTSDYVRFSNNATSTFEGRIMGISTEEIETSLLSALSLYGHGFLSAFSDEQIRSRPRLLRTRDAAQRRVERLRETVLLPQHSDLSISELRDLRAAGEPLVKQDPQSPASLSIPPRV